MKITKYRKRIKFTYIYTTLVILLLGIIFCMDYVTFQKTGSNVFHIYVNNVEVGTVTDPDKAREWMMDARKEIASQSDELVFMEVAFDYTEEELIFGETDEEQIVKDRIIQVLEAQVIETVQRAYTVKVNEFITSLSSEEEVQQLLEAAIGKSDISKRFSIELEQDTNREFNLLQARVVDTKQTLTKKEETSASPLNGAGIMKYMDEWMMSYVPDTEPDFLRPKGLHFPQNLGLSNSFYQLKFHSDQPILLPDKQTALSAAFYYLL